MELNKRILREETAAPLAGDPADAGLDLPEDDISAIDNGFTRISRAFFNAAYATKDVSQSNNQDHDELNNGEKRRSEMLLDLAIQQMIDSASSAIYQHIDELNDFINDIRQRQEKLEARQQELRRQREEALNQQEGLEEQQRQTLEEYEEVKEEEVTAQAEVAHAEAEQERCEQKENLLACAGKYTPEVFEDGKPGVFRAGIDVNQVYAGVQVRTAEQLSDAVTKLEDVQQKRSEIEDRLDAIARELEQVAQRIENIDNEIEKNEEELQKLALQREKLENDKKEALEFAQKIDDPEFKRRLAAGQVTQSEFQSMMPDSMKDKTRPGAATPQTALLPLFAQETLPPLYLTSLGAGVAAGDRLTHSASSALNDGGGIKGDSIQNSFAKAASGAPVAETMTPAPESPVIEQKNQLAVGGMGMN